MSFKQDWRVFGTKLHLTFFELARAREERRIQSSRDLLIQAFLVVHLGFRSDDWRRALLVLERPLALEVLAADADPELLHVSDLVYSRREHLHL